MLAERTGSRRWLSLLGVGLCLGGGLGTPLWQTAQSGPNRLWVLVLMSGAALAVELAFRLTTGRTLHIPQHPDSPA